jgi:hypothetical protein
LRDGRYSGLFLARSPRAGRIDLLFGDHLCVSLRDENDTCSPWSCRDVE